MSSTTLTRRDALAASLTVAAAAGLSAPPAFATHCSGFAPNSRGYVQGKYGQIHVRIGDSSDARASPLLCIHSFPDSGRMFEQVINRLQRRRSVVAPDLPGYGNSDLPRSRPDIGDYADAAADVLESLGMPGADVFAIGDGTSVAIELAQRHPQLIRSLVLAPLRAGAGDINPPWPPEGHSSLPTPDGQYLALAWGWHLSRGMPRWRETAARNQFPDVIRHPRESSWGPVVAARHDWLKALRQVPQPVLLIETSVGTPVLANPEFEDAHVKIVARPGWSHGFPDVLTQDVIELLEKWHGNLV